MQFFEGRKLVHSKDISAFLLLLSLYGELTLKKRHRQKLTEVTKPDFHCFQVSDEGNLIFLWQKLEK